MTPAVQRHRPLDCATASESAAGIDCYRAFARSRTGDVVDQQRASADRCPARVKVLVSQRLSPAAYFPQPQGAADTISELTPRMWFWRRFRRW